MHPSREAWLSAPDESFERHAVCPRPAPNQLGIGLAAPERIHVGERLSIAGYVALTGSDLLRPSPWAHRLTFVIARTDGVRVGRAHTHGKPVAAPAPFGGRKPDLSELRRRGVEYFTSNAKSLFDDAIEPGVTHLYAFMGPHISNVVRVEVVDPDEAAP